jgi:uncharacterized protein YkwD
VRRIVRQGSSVLVIAWAMAAAAASGQGLVVDTTIRGDVVAFYQAWFDRASWTPPTWSGNAFSCARGDVAAGFRAEALDLLNAYRAMTGLPGDLVWDAVHESKGQRAALMMEANARLAHDWGPPASPYDCTSDPGLYACWTQDGCEAAKSSNIAPVVGDARVLSLWIEDAGNHATLGDRRWLLSPRLFGPGLGATDQYTVLWIFGSTVRPPAPEVVAWPPPGYVPYPLVYAMWSFSVPVLTALDGSPTVTASVAGSPAPVTATVLPKYYADSTIGWTFDGGLPGVGPGMPDTPITITVDGLIGLGQTTYTYEVVVFDPATTPVPEVPALSAVGAALLAIVLVGSTTVVVSRVLGEGTST